MRFVLLFIFLGFVGFSGFSQKFDDDVYVVKEKHAPEPDRRLIPVKNSSPTDPLQDNEEYVYCQIVGKGRLFSLKISIEIDFGQSRSFFVDNRTLRNEDGSRKIFNSMVDALNYMSSDGWDFVQAYTITIGNQNVYHYLLRMRVLKEN